MTDKKDFVQECASKITRANSLFTSRPIENLTPFDSNLVLSKSPNRLQNTARVNNSTKANESSDRETMIANHHSIDLTLHSRASSSDPSTFKENSPNPDKINILKSKEIEKINANIMNICTSSETHEQKTLSEKSVSSLSLPLLSQASSICQKPLSDSYINSLPLFHRFEQTRFLIV